MASNPNSSPCQERLPPPLFLCAPLDNLRTILYNKEQITDNASRLTFCYATCRAPTSCAKAMHDASPPR